MKKVGQKQEYFLMNLQKSDQWLLEVDKRGDKRGSLPREIRKCPCGHIFGIKEMCSMWCCLNNLYQHLLNYTLKNEFYCTSYISVHLT